MGKYTNLAIIYNVMVFIIVGILTFLYHMFENKNKKKNYNNYIQHEFTPPPKKKPKDF